MKKKTLPKKPEMIQVGSEKERLYLKQLETDIQHMDGNFIAYVKDAKELDDITDSQVDAMNSYYMRLLMMQCVQPLSRGISADSIIQSIGMYAGMSLVSPDFRKQCHNSVQTMLYPVVERKAMNSPDSSFWSKYRDKILTEQNGGRLPLTPKSAALQQIAFSRQMYDMMRQDGADMTKIQEQYNNAMDVLSSRMDHDGVSMKDTIQAQHTIIGQFVQTNPEYVMYFKQLSDESVERSDWHETENGERVWTGEYHTSDGKDFDGFFTARMPKSKDEYANDVSKHMANVMRDCVSYSDIQRAFRSDEHQVMTDHYIKYMMADRIPLDDIEKLFGDEMQIYMNDWQKRYPDEAAREMKRRQYDVPNYETDNTQGYEAEY